MTEPGETAASISAGDLRTDLPGYRVHRDGELAEERTEVTGVWREDLVSFLIGCSFTFEAALLEAGVPVRHIEAGSNVPMYRTNRACRPAGALAGPLVVSMRPVPADQVATAVRVTSRYPAVHGAPSTSGRRGSRASTIRTRRTSAAGSRSLPARSRSSGRAASPRRRP